MKSRFQPEFLDSSTHFLRAIAHPIRLTIIDLLSQETRLPVSKIHESLEIDQAVASHHLRILKDKGVLFAQRVGKNTFYSLNSTASSKIVVILEESSNV